MLAFLSLPSAVGYTSCTSLFRGSPCLLVRGFQEGPHLLVILVGGTYFARIQMQRVSFGAQVAVQSHVHVQCSSLSLAQFSAHTCSHARTQGGEPGYNSTKSLIFVEQARLIREIREN